MTLDIQTLQEKLQYKQLIKRAFARIFDIVLWMYVWSAIIGVTVDIVATLLPTDWIFHNYLFLSLPHEQSNNGYLPPETYDGLDGIGFYTLLGSVPQLLWQYNALIILLLSFILAFVTNSFIAGIFKNTIGKAITGCFIERGDGFRGLSFYIKHELSYLWIVVIGFILPPISLLLLYRLCKRQQSHQLKDVTISYDLAWTPIRVISAVIIWGSYIARQVYVYWF